MPTEDLFPVDDQAAFENELVDRVTAALAASDPPPSVCSFSHITSVPAIILPLNKLAEACHAAGVGSGGGYGAGGRGGERSAPPPPPPHSPTIGCCGW